MLKEIEVLEKLVKFNTIKDKENKEILNYIEEKLLNLGFKTNYKGKYLIMQYGENSKVGFLGHTDTVEYIEGWKTDPFKLIEKDGNLYGLGSCDMKGGIAAFIESISKIDLKKLKYGIKAYFTYDEEIGFSGTYDIVNSNEEFPELMIFGEPTNNEHLVGGKGLLECELYFKGIKAHSSNPEKGKSANINAIKALNELNIFYENQIKNEKENYFEIPYTTMNIGILEGGSAKNSIPASAKACLDFRTIKDIHAKKIKDKLTELSSKYDFKVNIIEEIKPFFNEIEFIKERKTANFMTEASLIKENKVKKVILGPGPVTAHEIDEHISIESYQKTINQYKEIIEKLCN